MPEVRARRPLPMILLLIPFLYLAFKSPFSDPLQTVLEITYLLLILVITIRETSRNTDEVQVAAARYSASIGAYGGVICTVGLLTVMTHTLALAEFIARLAEVPANNLPPAATGFGLGAMAALPLVFLCALIAYATWYWRAAR